MNLYRESFEFDKVLDRLIRNNNISNDNILLVLNNLMNDIDSLKEQLYIETQFNQDSFKHLWKRLCVYKYEIENGVSISTLTYMLNKHCFYGDRFYNVQEVRQGVRHAVSIGWLEEDGKKYMVNKYKFKVGT